LAGFAVGVVSRQSLLGPERVRAGDALIAVASSGLHSNGFSLARRVIEQEMKIGLDQYVSELGSTAGEALLVPTKIYARSVAALGQALKTELHALCHITGGGIALNLPRVLPKLTLARVRMPASVPAIFELIARGGPVETAEMRRTFNLGVGLIALVAADAADKAISALTLAGERAWLLGAVESAAGEPRVEFSG
jgi:phosphoribosylformylglycinamidine cyclo-ligase